MLPAWATVAIAVGVAALGALAGLVGSFVALRVARLHVSHDVSEAWRTRMIDAAENYAACYKAAAWAAGYVFSAELESDRDYARARADEAVSAHEKLAGAATRIYLIYGPASAAGRAAQDCNAALATAIGLFHQLAAAEVDVDAPDEEHEQTRQAAYDERTKAEKAWERFLHEAHVDMTP